MTTALVTGANRGIGLSLVKLLKARGDSVIAACRRETPELTKLGVEVESGVDVTSDKSINLLAEKLTHGPVGEDDLAAVQRRREFPMRMTQAMQVVVQNNIVRAALKPGNAPLRPPWPIRLVSAVPFLQGLTARFLAVGVRPEHIKASKDSGTWQGTVGVAEHLGSDTFLYVNVEGIGQMTVRAEGEQQLHHGDTVWLTPDPTRIYRFDKDGRSLKAA